MTLTFEQLDELKRKHEAATPAPWTKCAMGGVAVGELRENTLAVAAGGEGELFCIEPECGYYIGQERFAEECAASEQAHRDESFLVELRNAADELLADARLAAQFRLLLGEDPVGRVKELLELDHQRRDTASAHPSAERWLPIEGWNYEVSDQGRVRSANPRYIGRELRVPVAGYGGYLRIELYRGKRRKLFSVASLVLTAFVCPRPPGYQAAHENGNRTDNRLTNLAWKTVSENTEDRFRHGTVAKGERSGRSKLTLEQVREMRALFAAGVSCRDVGLRFGVTKYQAWNIKRGRSWAGIP